MTNSKRRTPFVYWSQDTTNISLKVDIQKAEQVDLRVLDNGYLFAFNAFSHASDDGPVEYCFELPLYEAIKNEPILIRHETAVEIQLCKLKSCFWKYGILNENSQRNAFKWLKFDFAKWHDDPDDELQLDDQQDGHFKNNYLENMLKKLEQDKQTSLMDNEEFAKRMNMIYGTYLFFYNIVFFVIHFAVLALFLFQFISNTKANFFSNFWSYHYQTLLILTSLQYIDVLHSLTGLTKGSYKTSLLQVTGRIFMLLIINGCSPCSSWPPTFSLMVVYLLSEQFRYPYYALNSIGISMDWLTWLRYNAWLLLYPIGLFLEGIPLFSTIPILGVILVRSIPNYYYSGIYSLQLPNALNFSFNFGIFLGIFTVTCFPYIAFTLLRHMHRQRRSKMVRLYKMTKKTE